MKSDLLDELEAVVIKTLPSDRYLVRFPAGNTATVYPTGRMRKAHLKILINDRVMVQLSPYDLSMGRMTWRAKG